MFWKGADEPRKLEVNGNHKYLPITWSFPSHISKGARNMWSLCPCSNQLERQILQKREAWLEFTHCSCGVCWEVAGFCMIQLSKLMFLPSEYFTASPFLLVFYFFSTWISIFPVTVATVYSCRYWSGQSLWSVAEQMTLPVISSHATAY